jgi:hypothetical protein
MGCKAMVRFPAGAKHFSLLLSAQAGSEANPASYPMGTPEVKRPVHENYSPPLSAEVKNGGATPPLPTYLFMAWSLINYAQRQHCFFTRNIFAVTLRILTI